MDKRQSSENRMQTRLDELRIEIQALKDKSGRSEANLQLEYLTLFEKVDVKVRLADQKLELLKQSNDKKWGVTKAEFEAIWDSLHETIKLITSP